jgi:iron(III) transport system substrate-binding protein
MKRFMAVVFSLLLSVVLCGSLTFAANEKITLYISGPQEMIKALEQKFEMQHGDVLNVFATGCGPLKQKVWTEMLAGGVQADIIWGAEPMLYYNLQEKGVLQQYRSPQLVNLQKQYNYGNGYFTPVNARYGVIVYNAAKTPKEEIPHAWHDLTRKSWDKKLAMADAAQSSMALALTAGLYDVSGKNWNLLKAYNNNHLILTKTNEEVVAKVESGEVWAGIAPHDGVLRLMKRAKKKGIASQLRIVWPAEGAISVQRPVAIVRKNRSVVSRQLTQDFLDFSLSEAAQKIASKYGFITVCNGLSLPEGVPATVKANTLDWEDTAQQESQLLDGFTKIISSK